MTAEGNHAVIGIRNYVDLRIATEREFILGIEKRLEEKFQTRDVATEKDAKILDNRLSNFTTFREQMIAERGTYVTRDYLSVQLKGITDQLDIISRTVTLTAGQERGVSKTWQIIVTIFAVAGAVGTVVQAVAGFFTKYGIP